LFPPDWRSDPKWSLLFYGIDLQPFREPIKREDVRRDLNISRNTVVVGHVGRFYSQKNHSFLLDIAAAVVQIMPNVVFLLVGDGPLRNTMEAKARDLKISEHVRFLGVRKDISRLMRGAMDIFLFPSSYEGLPLVLLEAQASGLPCLISDRVSEQTDVIGSLIARESLSSSAEHWAERLAAMSREPNRCAERLPEDWSIETSFAHLTQAYHACLQ
jgi:glycosyltransferase involved in cell wall biosynthesis